MVELLGVGITICAVGAAVLACINGLNRLAAAVQAIDKLILLAERQKAMEGKR